MSDTDAQNTKDWPKRSRFRKKYQPYGVLICEETLDEIESFDDCVIEWIESDGEICISIKTREGKLKAYDGDWIMEDSEGHHYPIAEEEIRKTYEPARHA